MSGLKIIRCVSSRESLNSSKEVLNFKSTGACACAAMTSCDQHLVEVEARFAGVN
jgi:hypothetical protein